MKRLITLILAAIVSMGALRAQTAPATSLQVLPVDNNALATLAVQDHGRKKPFTTFAHRLINTTFSLVSPFAVDAFSCLRESGRRPEDV